MNGKRNGKGKEYYVYGDLLFKGEYLNGERNGKGEEYLWYGRGTTSFLRFKGEYLNGKRNGKGIEYYDNNKILFEGEYLNGKIWNGKGYDKNGAKEFEIKEGKGLVKEYFNSGFLLFKGEYLNGKRWNGTKFKSDEDDNIIEVEVVDGFEKK